MSKILGKYWQRTPKVDLGGGIRGEKPQVTFLGKQHLSWFWGVSKSYLARELGWMILVRDKDCQQFTVAGAEGTRQRAARQLGGDQKVHCIPWRVFSRGVSWSDLNLMGTFSILAPIWQVDLKENKKNLDRVKVKRLLILSKLDDR